MATVQPLRVRSGRGVELGLLVLALVLGVAAYALVGLGVKDKVPSNVLWYGVGMAVMAVGMHLVLRWRAPYADPVILPIVVALNGIGLAMIYRLDLAAESKGHPTDFAGKQLVWTAISVVLAAIVLIWLRDHRTLRRYTYTAGVAALVLMASPMLPVIGKDVNGARIWVRVGGVGLQPAELAKIALAIFFAGYLVTNRDTLTLAGPKVLGLQLPRVRDLGPILVVWGVSLAILVLQSDLGTSLLFFGLFVAVLYLATERLSWVAIGLVLFAGGAAAAVAAIPHVAVRFSAWSDALSNTEFNRPFGGSGQLVRGLFGMASGGLFGTGWGQGRPDLVPFAESDFIVPSLGEELGLTGLLAILVLYAVLTERGLRTAIGVRDGFGKLLAGGLAFVMAFQVFVVVGGVTRLIPLTGLTTPFLAYGGSSLVANWVIVALLLRVSDDARRPAPAMRAVATPSGGTPAVGNPAVGGPVVRRPAPRGAEPDENPTERIGGLP